MNAKHKLQMVGVKICARSF